MPNILFVNRNAQSLSLSGSIDDKERSLINTHVQLHRKHMRRTHRPITTTSTRPKYLDFQRKNDHDICNGHITSIDFNKENNRPKTLPSGQNDDKTTEGDSANQDFRLCTYRFYNNDWTMNLVPTSSRKLMDIRLHMRIFLSQSAMVRHIIPEAMHDKGLLNSLAYLTCSNLDALRNEKEAPSSLVAKRNAVCAINESLSSSCHATSIANMSAVCALATAVNIYDNGTGKEYLRHRKGFESMIATKIKAGPATLAATVAEKLCNRMIGLHRYIVPCVYNLEFPLPEYPPADYGYDTDDSVKLDDSSTGRGTISESPFYCPSPDFCYVQTSPYSDSRIIQLLRDIRDYYVILEEEQGLTEASLIRGALNRRLALRERLLGYQSIHSISVGSWELKKTLDKDYIFECIRLTALALIHISDTCVPIRIAFALTTTSIHDGRLLVKEKLLKPLPPLDVSSTAPCNPTVRLITSPSPSQIIVRLAYAIRKGPNSVVGWGAALEGVLYWVTTIGTAIARGRPEYRLFSSINAKTVLDATCSSDGRTWAEGFVPIQTFIKFQQMCCFGGKIARLVEIRDV